MTGPKSTNYSINSSERSSLYFIGRTTIWKVGTMSGLTMTVIIGVEGDNIFTNHRFSAPGDSGSIVFTQVDGVYFIVGIIAREDAKEDNDDDTEC